MRPLLTLAALFLTCAATAAELPDPIGDDDGITIITENPGPGGGDLHNVFFAGHPFTITFDCPLNTVAAFISGWIDWNGDGDWNDPGEKIITNLPIPAATLRVPELLAPTVTFDGTTPQGLTPKKSWSLFRISSTRDLAITGLAKDGEASNIEVYIGEAVDPPPPPPPTVKLDFGDAPPPYPSRLADDGARHASPFDAVVRFGHAFDLEFDAESVD